MMQNNQGEVAPSSRDATLDYLLDMLAEMAKLAHQAGHARIAIHLDALLAAERVAEGRRRRSSPPIRRPGDE